MHVAVREFGPCFVPFGVGWIGEDHPVAAQRYGVSGGWRWHWCVGAGVVAGERFGKINPPLLALGMEEFGRGG